MKKVKELTVDILVTAFIIIAVALNMNWMKIILNVYTPLMLFLKIFVLFGNSFTSSAKRRFSNTPVIFFHVLYAINVIVLLIGGWWILGIQWILIWIFSWIAQRKIQNRKK